MSTAKLGPLVVDSEEWGEGCRAEDMARRMDGGEVQAYQHEIKGIERGLAATSCMVSLSRPSGT
jgi:hypothetical protein